MTGAAFHPEALLDLEEIWDFLAQRSLESADRVIAEVLHAAEQLCEHPHLGHFRSDLTALPLNFLVVGDLLLVYAPEEIPLWVLAVLHGRRNPRVLAAALRGRE